MSFPPHLFASQGNPFVAPPGGPVTPASQLDQNFAACAPTVSPVNYPLGSGAAKDLSAIALANADFSSLTHAQMVQLCQFLISSGAAAEAGFLLS